MLDGEKASVSGLFALLIGAHSTGCQRPSQRPRCAGCGDGESRFPDVYVLVADRNQDDPRAVDILEVNNIITALRQMASERTLLFALLKRISVRSTLIS